MSVDPPPEKPPSAPHAARLPVLDAVRGLAICLVLAVHFTPDYLMHNRPLEWAKKLLFTGWSGVDLFFVLSGFLITDILLRVRQTPHWMRNFYGRRALRILPLYFTTLIVVFGIVPRFVPPGVDPAFDSMQATQGWYWLHAANINIFLHGFWAAENGRTVCLGHLWSLAVEEHFYLLWPFLLARTSERRLVPVLLGLIGGALAVRLAALAWLPAPMLAGAFVQTPARMDGLACGALLAVCFHRVPPPELRRWALRLLTLTGTILAFDFFREKGLGLGSSFVRSIGYTLLAVFYASLIVVLLTDAPTALLRRAVDNPVLRFFGKYSYGIYVIHMVMAQTLERWFPEDLWLERLHSPALAALVILSAKTAVSVALAWLSWRLLEAPCLRLKDRFDYSLRSSEATVATPLASTELA